MRKINNTELRSSITLNHRFCCYFRCENYINNNNTNNIFYSNKYYKLVKKGQDPVVQFSYTIDIGLGNYSLEIIYWFTVTMQI